MCICKQIIAKEFWLDEKQISPCCALYLELEGEGWAVASYNDEKENWVIENSSGQPNKNSSQENNDYRYTRYLDQEVSNNLDYQNSEQTENRITLLFNKGITIELFYNTDSESEEIIIN